MAVLPLRASRWREEGNLKTFLSRPSMAVLPPRVFRCPFDCPFDCAQGFGLPLKLEQGFGPFDSFAGGSVPQGRLCASS